MLLRTLDQRRRLNHPSLIVPAARWIRPHILRQGQQLRAVAKLQEVLKAAKEGDGAPLEAKDAREVDSDAKKAAGSESQHGVIWFSNIYPTKIAMWDIRQAFTHHNHETLIPKLLPEGIEVTRMVPREREGGAFVWFQAPPAVCKKVQELDEGTQEQPFFEKELTWRERRERKTRSQRKALASDPMPDALWKVIAGISQYLKTHPVRAFLSPFPVRAHRVHGKPYLEDLSARYPGPHLNIKILGASMQAKEEYIFSRLRRYGELVDIRTLPDGQGFRATFNFTAAAIAARNCLHRAPVDPAEIGSEASAYYHIEFEPMMQKWLKDAVLNHPRYSIPVIVLALASTTYFIWDPLRTASVQFRIAGVVNEADADNMKFTGLWGQILTFWTQWRGFEARWSMNLGYRLRSALSGKASKGLLQDFWSDRDGEICVIRQLLKEPNDNVMLLTGPRGNGQGMLVYDLLECGRGAVYIDVGQMLDQSADEQVFLRRFCKAFGYAPAPLAEGYMGTFLDVISPGTGKFERGVEALSTAQRVLSCTTQALLDISQRSKAQSVPPLFVIDGFTIENKGRHKGFFELLVTWAAYVTDARLARVLFVADSMFAEPTILAALKGRPEKLEVHQLPDADLASVRAFLERQLGVEATDSLTDEDLAIIGGRFRDVAALVAHAKEGATPQEAIRKLVEASAITVRTLLATAETQQDAQWTRQQLWRAVRLLATAESNGFVPFDAFLWLVFRGNETALQSMLRSNLIRVAPLDNPPEGMLRRRAVYPGSPLYAEVYRRLIRHQNICAVLDLEVAKEDLDREQAKLDQYEAQLCRLQEVDDVRREKGRDLVDPNDVLQARKRQLLELIGEQHTKLEGYHQARRSAQAILGKLKDKMKASSPLDSHLAEPPTRASETVESPERSGWASNSLPAGLLSWQSLVRVHTAPVLYFLSRFAA